MIKDAFGFPLDVGNMVIYSVSGSRGTVYMVGTISKLYPSQLRTPDRVAVNVIKSSRPYRAELITKDPIVYAMNVVAYNEEQNEPQ